MIVEEVKKKTLDLGEKCNFLKIENLIRDKMIVFKTQRENEI